MLDSRSARLWFAFALWWPSVGLFIKFAGVAPAVGYSVLMASSILWLAPIVAKVRGRVSPQAFTIASWGLLLSVTIMFSLVFPHANSHLPFHGSDEDDALNVAAHTLLQGRWLYAERTYLGNPIAPLPGAILLAVPFVILGTSALQNLLWLPVLGWDVQRRVKDRGVAVLFWVTVLLLCPALLRDLVTGSDLLANGIYVAAFSLAALRVVPDESQPAWVRGIVVMLWGASMSSRALFWPIAPLLLLAIAFRSDRRTAIGAGVLALIAWLAVTLPFYSGHAGDFPPLHTSSKLTLGGAIPLWLGLGLFSIALALSLVLLVRDRRGSENTFLLATLLSLAAPLVALTLIYTAMSGREAFIDYTTYGITFLPLAVLYAATASGTAEARNLTSPPKDPDAANSSTSAGAPRIS